METNPIEWQMESEQVARAYTERLQQHGLDVNSLNWGSAASQERRFEVLAGVGLQDGMSLLDVGCGLGDFYLWAQRNGLRLQYTGLDVTPAMVLACRERFPEMTFHEGDIVTWAGPAEKSFDFVIASGIFYDRPESGHAYMKAALEAMLRLGRIGVAFNSLTNLADQPDPGEFRPAVAQLAELCASLTPRFVVRHDYHPCDATIYLYPVKGQP